MGPITDVLTTNPGQPAAGILRPAGAAGGQSDPGVRRATGRDLEPLISLMVAAFSRTALGAHLVADERERRHVMRLYFRIIMAHAVTYGNVQIISGGQAAAVWHRVSGPDRPKIPGYDLRLAEATGKHHSRFVDWDFARATHHPLDHPHEHLAYLAVHPALRGKQLDVQLLEHRHRELDTTGRAVYVDATSSSSESQIFAELGYDPMDLFPAGRSAPSLHPMWRPAGEPARSARSPAPRPLPPARGA